MKMSKSNNNYNDEYNNYNKSNRITSKSNRRKPKSNKYNNYSNTNRNYSGYQNKASRSYYYQQRNNKHQQYQYSRGGRGFRWNIKRGNNRQQQYNRNSKELDSPPPFVGTEEHTQQKIQKHSDMIKKQLDKTGNQSEKHQYFNDEDFDEEFTTLNQQSQQEIYSHFLTDCNFDKNPTNNLLVSSKNTKTNDKEVISDSSTTKPIMAYNIKAIQDEIIKKLSKLSHREKIKFITSSSTPYDSVVSQIQTRKRLELSQSLREIYSQRLKTSDYDDGILPDIGVKIDDLPTEVMDQITETLNLDEILVDDNRSNDKSNSQTSDSLLAMNDIKQEGEEEEEMEIDVKPDLSKLNVKQVAEISSHSPNVVNAGACSLENFNENTNSCDNNNKGMIDKIMEIDDEIMRLTKTRQELLLQFYDNNSNSNQNNLLNSTINSNKDLRDNSRTQSNKTNLDFSKEIDLSSIVNEKVLVIKIFNNLLLAGTESGKLFFKDLVNEDVFVIYVTTRPLISIVLTNNSNMYIGCLEPTLRLYDYNKRILLKTIKIDHSIQCMEIEWGYNFIGCVNGFLLRYSIKKNRIEFEEKISEHQILALKATQEGTRKILLVASRNTPVCIRDAMSGLHLRTMDNLISPTTTCILFERNLVYCGTNSHDVLVFNFHDGKLFQTLKATNSKGISCMKIIKNLLFVSCYNGNIYVYNIRNYQLIGFLKGPGGVIVSMDVIENLVIVGTLSMQFKSILIPNYFLKSNSD